MPESRQIKSLGITKIMNLISILAILLACSAILALWIGVRNRDNQGFLVATATVCAGIVFYGINLFTSLRESTRSATVAVEITADRAHSFLGSHLYSLSQSMRADQEKDLTERLSKSNPSLLQEYPTNIAREFFVASTLKWLAMEEFDWQAEAKVLTTSSGRSIRKGRTSLTNRSAVITEDDIKKQLQNAGNVFAEHFTMPTFKEILLPKGSTFKIGKNGISISHPVFELRIELEEPGQFMINVNPRTQRMEMLPTGQPRISTEVYAANLSFIIKKFRSGDPNKTKYEAWFARLERSLRVWFEVPRTQASESTPIGAVVSDGEK